MSGPFQDEPTLGANAHQSVSPPPAGKNNKSSTETNTILIVVTVAILAVCIAAIAVLVLRGDDESDDNAKGSTELRTDDRDDRDDREPEPDPEPAPEPTPAPVAVTLPTVVDSPAVDISTPPPTTQLPTASYAYEGIVARTCGRPAVAPPDCFLSVRVAPNSSSTEVRRHPEGTTMDVECAVSGTMASSSVLNRRSNVWVRTTDGYYAAQIFLDVPGWDLFSPTVSC